jgi:hypothetical protein
MPDLYPIMRGKAYRLAGDHHHGARAQRGRIIMKRYAETDLVDAKALLAAAEGRDHRANNPNKGRAYIKRLRLEVSAIEAELRWQETATPEQIAQCALDDELNFRFPNAKSKTVVEHDGQRYQLKVKPISFSYGVPTDWSRSWHKTDLPVGEPPPKKQKQLRPEFRRSVHEIVLSSSSRKPLTKRHHVRQSSTAIRPSSARKSQ